MGNGPLAPNPLNPTGVNWMPNWMGNNNNDNNGASPGVANSGPGGDPGIGPFFNNTPKVFPGDQPYGLPSGGGMFGSGPPPPQGHPPVFPGDGPYNGGPQGPPPSPNLPPHLPPAPGPIGSSGATGIPPQVYPGDGPYNGAPQGPPPPSNLPPYLPTAPGSTPGSPSPMTGQGDFGSGFNVSQVGQTPTGAGGDPYNTPISMPLNNSTLNQPQTTPSMSNKQPPPSNPFQFGGGG